MRIAPLCTLACLSALALSCAQEVGDIDRTQPNLLSKAMFVDHAWYVRQTVIDVPPTSTFSFAGETGALEIIRWEVQQDYLVGYRAYESVPGADSSADHAAAGAGEQPVAEGYGEGRDPDVFKGNPIVAYPILDHVDIVRDYNERTGEQNNVIREDALDRPWYERSYVRVDWSKNLVANFQFISSARRIEPTHSGYVEENEGGPDAFTRHLDEAGGVDYFDFTERLFVEPTERGCILSMNYQLGDCTGDEVKVRTSFLRVDEARERDYVPLSYDDQRQGEFGYFRVERPSYDRRYGVTWSGVTQLATRHDVWRDSRAADGSAKPHAERGLRPIVYTLSERYPRELLAVTEEIAAEWDRSLKQTLATARSQTIAELEADLREQTGDICMFCLDHNEDGHARMGDLRYNFLYWVDNPQLTGPLGYGPSSAHPETGRIVSAAAFVYGAAVDARAQEAQDIVALLTGERVPEDFVGAEFVAEQVSSRKPPVSEAHLSALLQRSALGEPGSLLSPRQRARVEAIRQQGLPQAIRSYDTSRLSRIRGTAFERMLVNDEIVLSRGQGQYLPDDPLSDEAIAQLSPLSWANVEARKLEARRQARAAQHSVWLNDFSDPGVIGLARAMRAEGLRGDALWSRLREDIYKGVMLHEIGHTLGLRHNFGASADALNYHPEYWPLREKTVLSGDLTVADLLRMSCELATNLSDAEACVAQQNGRMREYQYSSIMDYGAKFNSDIHGLGHYDHAAIAAGYGDLVEVFTPAAVAALGRNAFTDDDRGLVETMAAVRAPTLGSLTEIVHYTALPIMFGDASTLEARRFIPRAEYLAQQGGRDAPLRVPYIACYDEYVDATSTCHRWDEGADPYEISMHYINTYREYYPLVNLQRDRVNFSPAAVGDRILDRYFLPLANMYQHWLFSLGAAADPLLRTYSELGMMRGFSLLWNVMSTPRYGSYDLIDGVYVWRGYEESSEAALYLPPGLGRRQFSRYDTSSGFNFYQRVIESGYFYEQIGALTALTANDASLLGIGSDVDADLLSFSIPYYLVFQDQIDALFTGIVTQDFASYGPYMSGNTLYDKDLWLEAFAPIPADAVPLQVDTSPTLALYTMLYGTALLSSNFDAGFLQKAQVAIVGESETIEPGAGFEEVRATDPFSGRTYAAYRDPGGDPNSFLGAKLVERVQQEAELLTSLEEGSAEALRLQGALREDIETLEILRSLYATYQYVLDAP